MIATADTRDRRPDAAALIGGLVFAVLLLDAEGRIAETNHAAEMLLGKSEKRLLGQTLGDVVELIDERVVELTGRADSSLIARDIRLFVDGQEHRVNLTISPLAAYPGWRVVTLSDAGRDDAAREQEGEAASLGAPAILAHEIRNPLAAIRGAAQLAARKLDPADRGLARMITDEVDRIARLIDRMQQLGRSRPEVLGPTNLHEAIRSAIATVRAAGNDAIEIAEEFDPSLPPVMSNRDALEQVLINLLSNACDVLRAGDTPRPQVTVRTRFVSGFAFSAVHFGRTVRLPIEITVSDNGPGIDETLRDHIFEPFVTSKKSGQGLGLALVRKLVRDMKGRIGHERDNRAGLTHFRVHLAIADNEDPA
ncbi:MAG: two-component system sensor histidine kinase NtrB [Erythrobacter sp.]